MKSLRRAANAVRSGSARSKALLVVALIGALAPTQALAAEGEHISLKFDSSQTVTLGISFAIGVLSLIYGLFYLRSFVLRQSPGDQKMQDVGLAIREGALAYLRRQIGTMSIFIALLFFGLVGLYWRMGAPIALGVGFCFVCGVIASYVSGYAGMLMAVNGNMRTANAALTSFRLALVTAFRSGAVAGTVTVGIGLIGATLILLLAPTYATNLLIGFGFGASLAALFMRVGGGIFTKAADVGADLVGKVEAGIPEDDPRNPAVIADNVGDNVGDCAGMAADVFESYEVTLIASIVLGAATSVVFDAQTWPRLIVFGLAASAIGLMASIVGIQLVDGSDDPNSDPLTALKKGFNISAAISFVGVGILAYLTMGGNSHIGSPIQTTQLKPLVQYQEDEIRAVQDIRRDLAKKAHKEFYEITPQEILADPRATAMGLNAKDDLQTVSGETRIEADRMPPAPDLTGLSKVVDDADLSNKALDYAVVSKPTPTNPGNPAQPFTSVNSLYGPKADPLVVFQMHHSGDIKAHPAQGNVPATTNQHVDETRWAGPVRKSQLDDQLSKFKEEMAKQKSNETIDIVSELPLSLYTSPDGRIALGLEGGPPRPGVLKPADDLNYFKIGSTDANTVVKTSGPSAQPLLPPQSAIDVAIVNHATVPWFAFWLTLAFGILMAFAIEFITDYYVSTHKPPTREVAGVATAGAAPMVIQGFAHALTSSVFMVLAIVVALLFPLFIFNPGTYGGYTLSFYGIALVGLGLLTATAYVLAMDTFGPISDNAQGVFEMSGAAHEHPQAAKIVARLDAAGNTTKALTKGFAIATAVVAAVALFHSYLAGAHLESIGLRLDVPEIFLGLLIGGAAPYLFSAFAINAVGRSSFELINEVRRQFREDAGIMLGTSKPDYARCVSIVTASAQKELLAPGILAIALPAAVGFGFSIGKPTTEIGGEIFNLTGAQALGGFLAGAIVSGQLMAVLLANAGGMWDNAKKLIEDGLHGGKGTEAHKAAIVGDTIGDPFKDTAGPALNPLIKVMNLVGLLLSGVVILPLGTGVLVAITGVCIVALVGSVMLARRGSMSDALQAASKEAVSADAHFTSSAPAGLSTPTSAEPPKPGKKKLFVEEDPNDED